MQLLLTPWAAPTGHSPDHLTFGSSVVPWRLGSPIPDYYCNNISSFLSRWGCCTSSPVLCAGQGALGWAGQQKVGEQQQSPRAAQVRFCSAVFRAGFTAASAASQGTAECDREPPALQEDPCGRWSCAFRPWENWTVLVCGFSSLVGFVTFMQVREVKFSHFSFVFTTRFLHNMR